MFLKRLKRELNIPILGFVDADPYGARCEQGEVGSVPCERHPTGLKILSVYMSGSKNMSYDSARYSDSLNVSVPCDSNAHHMHAILLLVLRFLLLVLRASLTTPDIKWLGLRPSDLNKYQ